MDLGFCSFSQADGKWETLDTNLTFPKFLMRTFLLSYQVNCKLQASSLSRLLQSVLLQADLTDEPLGTPLPFPTIWIPSVSSLPSPYLPGALLLPHLHSVSSFFWLLSLSPPPPSFHDAE